MRVAVVGGGVSGLAAACEALRLCPTADVLVLEASARIGGLVHTERSSEGFLFEHGPDSLHTRNPEGLRAIYDFGLSGEVVTGTDAPRTAFLARRARLIPLPAGVIDMGPGATTGYLRLRQSRSAIGPRQISTVSLCRGMASLPLAMARALGRRVRLENRVEHITQGPRGRYRLEVAGRGTLQADAVIMAAPAFHAATICSSLSLPLADELAQIRHAGYASVHLSFRLREIAHPMDGSGFIVPAREGRSLAACTWMHRKWPTRAPGDAVLLRCFVRPPYHTHAELVERALTDLEALMGIHGAPELLHVVSRRRALPCYAVGHRDRVARLAAAADTLPGFALAGNALHGAGIPDCIAVGRSAAQRIVAAG
jgi:protoporphyrinogen oxidase